MLEPHYVRDVLSVMTSCGMYDYAGQWSYEVGMPAKSGVSGGIMAVIPGQVGIGVYSPPLDAQGNSVRGIKVCQDISNEFELHAFNNRTNVRSVIRRVTTAAIAFARAACAPPRSASCSTAKGVKIAVIEVQGALFFGSTEQLLRRIAELSETARYIIVDFKRVHLADSSARKLILRLAHAMRAGQTELLFAEIANDGPLAGISRELAEHETERLLRVFRDVDAALEWCEDQLLSNMLHQSAEPKFALSELDVFKGLNAEEYRLVETIVSPLIFEKGEVIIREGDQAKLFFVLGAGQRERADQDSHPDRREAAARGLHRPRAYFRRDGAVRRRRPLGRRHRRREGHLLWVRGSAAQGARRRASQHHDDDPLQSDPRFFRALAPRQRGDPLARVRAILGLEAGPQQEMRALLVVHAVSRPERGGELEEVYDHLGEMVCRERAVAAPARHKFKIGQRRQGLGGPSPSLISLLTITRSSSPSSRRAEISGPIPSSICSLTAG